MIHIFFKELSEDRRDEGRTFTTIILPVSSNLKIIIF